MEQLSVHSLNELYLGKQVEWRGLMEEEEEEEEDSLVRTAQPPLLDVVLSGSPPSLPGLSFSTSPHCVFSFSPGPSLHSVQGLF